MNPTTAVAIVVTVAAVTAAYVIIKRSHGQTGPVQLQPVPAPVHAASPAPALPAKLNTVINTGAQVLSGAKDLFNQVTNIFEGFKLF